MTIQKWLVNIHEEKVDADQSMVEMRYDSETQKFAMTATKSSYLYCEKEKAAAELNAFLTETSEQEP